MDAWLLLKDLEGNGERNRVLYVLKARGMAHSNQIREFLISNHGVDLVDAYIGASGVLTGSSRLRQAAQDKAQSAAEQQKIARRRRELEQEQTLAQAQLGALQLKTTALAEELKTLASDEQTRLATAAREQAEVARVRGADGNKDTPKKGSHAHVNKREKP
jgi:circadian clock protein KaiC